MASERVDFVACIEGVVHHLSRLDVLEFGPDKCRPFSRLHMEKLHDLPQAVVVVEDHAVFDVTGVRHADVLVGQIQVLPGTRYSTTSRFP